MSRHLLSATAVVAYFTLSAPSADAQRRASAPYGWAVPWSEEALAPQQQRLPILDDSGAVIPYGAVVQRVDPSGLAGAVVGVLVLGTIGAAIGTALGDEGCDDLIGNTQYFCSPRQNAMRDTLPWALGLAFGSIGGWIGWDIDQTTWQEALEDLRALRRSPE